MSYSSYPALLNAWSETSSRLFSSVMEANRAAISAFGVHEASVSNADCSPNGPGAPDTPDTQEARDADDSSDVEDRIEPAGDLSEWDVVVDVGNELSVGDIVTFTKTISEADVDRFAAASGDTNPIHLDDEWAGETRFNGRIVHGVLAAGLISAALARLPGSVVYLSQDLEFRAPVRLGDRITADVKVVENLGGERYRLRTTVSRDDDELVIDGEAVVLIDDSPDGAPDDVE